MSPGIYRSNYPRLAVPLREGAVAPPPASSQSGPRKSGRETEVASNGTAEASCGPLTPARSLRPKAAAVLRPGLEWAAASTDPDPGQSPGSELQLFDTRKEPAWA